MRCQPVTFPVGSQNTSTTDTATLQENPLDKQTSTQKSSRRRDKIFFTQLQPLVHRKHVEPGNYREHDRKIIWIYVMLQMRSIQYRVLVKVTIVVHEEANTLYSVLCNKQEQKVLLIYRQAKLQCSLILECYTCIYHACVYYDATRQSQT